MYDGLPGIFISIAFMCSRLLLSHFKFKGLQLFTAVIQDTQCRKQQTKTTQPE